jgi:hypothetical protein
LAREAKDKSYFIASRKHYMHTEKFEFSGTVKQPLDAVWARITDYRNLRSPYGTWHTLGLATSIWHESRVGAPVLSFSKPDGDGEVQFIGRVEVAEANRVWGYYLADSRTQMRFRFTLSSTAEGSQLVLTVLYQECLWIDSFLFFKSERMEPIVLSYGGKENLEDAFTGYLASLGPEESRSYTVPIISLRNKAGGATGISASTAGLVLYPDEVSFWCSVPPNDGKQSFKWSVDAVSRLIVQPNRLTVVLQDGFEVWVAAGAEYYEYLLSAKNRFPSMRSISIAYA